MKIIYTIVLYTLCISLGYTQAKKPTIMVVPSDRYCIANGYVQTIEQLGKSVDLPDYKKALQNDEKLRLAISQMGAIMVERDFPLKDLETVLKRIETTSLESSVIMGKQGGMIAESPVDIVKRTAKADIILDFDFSIKEADLGMKYINFNLKGVDSYSGKIIGAATGSGAPYMTNQVELLLQMAVKDHMDNFNALLSAHFEEMFDKGREIVVEIRTFDSSGYALDTEYSYPKYEMEDELSYIIEEFFARKSVKGRFSVGDISETTMRFDQVRMPLFNEKDRAIDARRFVRGLQKMLAAEPFNIQSKLYTRGLGEVWLILGEK